MRAGAVASALFLLSAAFVLTKTGRDALYFQGEGLLDLPAAYAGMAILALPAAMGMVGLMQALGPRPARVAAVLATAIALLAFRGVAEPGGGLVMTLFFLLVPLVFGVLFSAAWLLGADLLECEDRNRLAGAYGTIGSAAIGGGVASAIAARLAAARIDPADFLPWAAALLIGCAAILLAAQKRWPPRVIGDAEDARAPRLADFAAVLRERYSLTLMAVAMTAGLVGILVEFQFYFAAALSGNDGRENAAFFANFYLLLNGLALATQVLAVPRILRRVGVHGSLYVLPIALLAGAGALLASATVVTRAALRVAEGGIKASVHRSSWEQAYLPLGRARRAAAKLLVDGAGARSAEGIAAVLLFLWVRDAQGGVETLAGRGLWLTGTLAVAGAAWVSLTWSLGRTLRPLEATVSRDGRIALPLPDS